MVGQWWPWGYLEFARVDDEDDAVLVPPWLTSSRMLTPTCRAMLLAARAAAVGLPCDRRSSRAMGQPQTPATTVTAGC